MPIFISGGSSSSKDVERNRKVSKPSPKKWHTDREQNIYSSKLIETLRRIRRSSPKAEDLRRSRVIREAADRILAVAGRGRTRWSRAILFSRNLKIKHSRPRKAVHFPTQPKKRRRSQVLKCKAGVLGRLVPGCRKLSFPTLLEEASDYIAALQMQVRAMASLTAILSASGGFSSPDPDRYAP
ncbi:hypothetical protein IEQ34_009734 [Dendrobium chrysotoxum]|uniref:IBH1-like N-terminal domain-containing protein n=1 Tax=Dendrobium chrysotoxum TaxID=161865 RepID=A0AAV7H288_DENCH|nr:hypothetical protein IEQ34_009734 [Dendrobium chrysotoxum]